MGQDSNGQYITRRFWDLTTLQRQVLHTLAPGEISSGLTPYWAASEGLRVLGHATFSALQTAQIPLGTSPFDPFSSTTITKYK